MMEQYSELCLPTIQHRQFVEYIDHYCAEIGVSALLKGSLVKRTAMKRSDVDIILLVEHLGDRFDCLVTGFDRVLLSEHSKYSSTYLVVYRNGLTVEYDIRNSITPRDFNNGVPIGCHNYIFSNIERDRCLYQSYVVPNRYYSYSKIMIAQMCLSKILCNKSSLALDIYNDRMAFMNEASKSGDRVSNIFDLVKLLYNMTVGDATISRDIIIYFCELFTELNETCGFTTI